MSRLPDWLHPWRWYAAAVIVEALYRYLILGESARQIGIRFGRSADRSEWRSLRRWREQLLVSPTLWGWLGKRLGITTAARNNDEGSVYLVRFFAEMALKFEASAFVGKLWTSIRQTFAGLVHDRTAAWPLLQFRPERALGVDSGRLPMASPTEKDAGRDPPA